MTDDSKLTPAGPTFGEQLEKFRPTLRLADMEKERIKNYENDVKRWESTYPSYEAEESVKEIFSSFEASISQKVRQERPFVLPSRREVADDARALEEFKEKGRTPPGSVVGFFTNKRGVRIALRAFEHRDARTGALLKPDAVVVHHHGIYANGARIFTAGDGQHTGTGSLGAHFMSSAFTNVPEPVEESQS